jgi:hypothetical protein
MVALDVWGFFHLIMAMILEGKNRDWNIPLLSSLISQVVLGWCILSIDFPCICNYFLAPYQCVLYFVLS